jgi:hypothetical protein
MSGLAAIVLGAVVAVALAPLMLRLARRWRRGAAGFAAGTVLPDGGVGGYISRLRGGAEFHGESDSADSSAADVDSD